MAGSATGVFTSALAIALSLPASLAEAQDRLLAVVLVTGEEDRELAGRVEGQTSDLDVLLVIERRAGVSGAAPELGEAAFIASQHGARVVIWFERDTRSWLVHIAEPGGEREFVRRVAAQGDLASSATAEGVGLVVRSALRALAAGGTIGVADPTPRVVRAPLLVTRPSRRGFAAVGWRGVTAGGPTIHHGVAARAGLATGRWHGELTTGFHPAVAIDEQAATIELERWTFAVGFGVELGASPAAEDVGWRTGFALDAGLTRFSRATTVAADSLMPTPPESIWSPTASGRARLARRVGGRAWLELSVGAELLIRAPEFGVASGGSFAVHTRLRLIEPFGALALVIDLG